MLAAGGVPIAQCSGCSSPVPDVGNERDLYVNQRRIAPAESDSQNLISPNPIPLILNCNAPSPRTDAQDAQNTRPSCVSLMCRARGHSSIANAVREWPLDPAPVIRHSRLLSFPPNPHSISTPSGTRCAPMYVHVAAERDINIHTNAKLDHD